MNILQLRFALLSLFTTIVACAPERPPGLPERSEDQAAYVEQPPAWTCLDVKDRAYVITTKGASQPTDTLFLVGDRMESAAQFRLGFMAASFACSEEGKVVRVTCEMVGAEGGLLQWSCTISGDLIDGQAIWMKAGQPSVTSTFEGASIAMKPHLLSPPKADIGS